MNKPEEIEFERSYVIRHEQCPKCAEEGRDTSEDNLAVYADGGQFCYSTHGIISSCCYVLYFPFLIIYCFYLYSFVSYCLLLLFILFYFILI